MIVPNVPAALILCSRWPGTVSKQCTRVPICKAPNGYASPSFARTIEKKLRKRFFFSLCSLCSINIESFFTWITRNHA